VRLGSTSGDDPHGMGALSVLSCYHEHTAPPKRHVDRRSGFDPGRSKGTLGIAMCLKSVSWCLTVSQ
jgi:hypothetical protein